MKIRNRYALLTVSLVWAVVGAIALTIVKVQRRLLETEAGQRREAILDGVMDMARESQRSKDDLMLLSYLKLLRREHPELALATVALPGHVARLGEPSPGLISVSGSVAPQAKQPPGEALAVQLGFDVQAAGRQISESLRPLIWRVIAIAVVFMLLGVGAVSYLSRLILGPLAQLAEAVTALGQGRWDVSVPVGADDEVAGLARRFNKMTISLKEFNKFREDILHTLTHELNTPLGSVRAYLQMLRADEIPPGEKRNKILDAMIEANARMGYSLESALSQFRVEHQARGPALAPVRIPEPTEEEPPKAVEARKKPAEAPPASPSPERVSQVPVKEMIAEVVILLAPSAQEKNIALMAPPDCDAWLFVDKELLRQVLMNLISNAIKYTPEGGRVDSGCQMYGDTLVLSVSDTGYGIPADDIPHIFEKFSRAGAGSQGAAPGTGLGLGIAKQAVETMGGRIWLESGVGKGTTFYVSLPQDLRKGKAREIRIEPQVKAPAPKPFVPRPVIATPRKPALVREPVEVGLMTGSVVRMKEIIGEVLAGLAAAAQAKNISLIAPPADSYGWLYADKGYLRDVLGSLVSNAIKYTPKDGRVEASFQLYGDTFIIWVADTGFGIPAKDVPRVLAKSSTKTTVESMGGRMWLETGVGKGTIFYVSLPQDFRKGKSHG